MGTSTNILEHINSLNPQAIFTTRDMLTHARRAAVDQTLARLTRRGFIRRLARGVFIRNIPDQRPVSAAEIALIKAAAFGKRIMTHARDCALKFGLISESSSRIEFEVSGHSSSFVSIFGEIVLRGVSSRKLFLGDSPHGMLMRAFWYLKRTQSEVSSYPLHLSQLNASELHLLQRKARWVPSWLSDAICHAEPMTPPLVPSPYAST